MKLPDTVALSEPIDPKVFAGLQNPDEALIRIEDFASRTRSRILAERRAPSIVVDGDLSDEMVVAGASHSGLRKRQGKRGEIRLVKPLSPEFTLIIKHNALFAALLSKLTDAFECIALVRNPLAVLASWQTVDLPVNLGRIPAGERFDNELCRSLMVEPGVLQRQVAILNWFFSSYQAHLQPGNIVRYEDLVIDGGSALFRLVGQSAAPAAPLENRNANSVYRGVEPEVLLDALIKDSGAWSDFYAPADCMRLVDLIGAHR